MALADDEAVRAELRQLGVAQLDARGLDLVEPDDAARVVARRGHECGRKALGDVCGVEARELVERLLQARAIGSLLWAWFDADRDAWVRLFFDDRLGVARCASPSRSRSGSGGRPCARGCATAAG